MQAEPVLVDPPGRLCRVERSGSSLRFSRLDPVDALNPRAGNRFDVPGAGVLYAASQPQGALAETLAGFRPSASMLVRFAKSENDQQRVIPGQVPAQWFNTRRIRSFHVDGALPFLDIEATATHTFLTEAAASILAGRSVQNLDVAHVRGQDRLLTRAIAGWAYAQADSNGDPLYAGIRYVSRLGDFECWAIFDGTRVILDATENVSRVDSPVVEIAALLGLFLR